MTGNISIILKNFITKFQSSPLDAETILRRQCYTSSIEGFECKERWYPEATVYATESINCITCEAKILVPRGSLKDNSDWR